MTDNSRVRAVSDEINLLTTECNIGASVAISGGIKVQPEEEKPTEYLEIMKKPNLAHVFAFMWISMFSSIYGGYVMAYTNQVTPML